MKAEDILSEQQNMVERDGVLIRKGTVAAFIANALIIDDPRTSDAARAAAEHDLRSLLPALKLLQVFDVFELKSDTIRALVGNCE